MNTHSENTVSDWSLKVFQFSADIALIRFVKQIA